MKRILILSLAVMLICVACSSGSDDTSGDTGSYVEGAQTDSQIASPTATPSDSAGLEAQVTTQDVIDEPIAVIDSISPNPVTLYEKVSFQGSSPSANITGYRWTIEGNSSVTGKAAFTSSTVTKQAGTYKVTFQVQNTDGIWSSEVEQTLKVLPVPPMANFSVTPTFGIAPLTVQFTGLPSREITGCSWDFGDGGTSSELSPAHIYEKPGVYTISFMSENEGGSDTETKEELIEVIVLDFSASPTSGYAPLQVNFNFETSASIAEQEWKFGELLTSSDENPSHVYTGVGDYDVSLTVMSEVGHEYRVSKPGLITVLDPTLVADFQCNPVTHINVPEEFRDFSTGNITSWTWMFGDGTMSFEQSPIHTFTTSGTYIVTLTVGGLTGRTDFIQRTVTVQGPT